MITQYLRERAKWNKFGQPLRTQKEMDNIFAICNACPQYKKFSDVKGQCMICGCHIKKEGTFLNKIAWGTTRCPLEEPKWTESEERFSKDLKITHDDLFMAEQEHTTDLTKNQKEQLESFKPGGCGCS